MELQHKQSRAVAVTSLAFPHGDVNNFIVGSEEGAVFTGAFILWWKNLHCNMVVGV